MHPNHTTPQPETKTFTKCGETKPLVEFKDQGRQSLCKICDCVRARAYRARTENKIAMYRYQREYAKRNREALLEYSRAYVAAHGEKRQAKGKIANAVARGRMVPASAHFCFVCGLSSDQGVVMHYHHLDYSKPFEVIPVCAGCHKLWHAAQESDNQGK